MHFGISEGKGGLKLGSRPWLGMDIFWNCPMEQTRKPLKLLPILKCRSWFSFFTIFGMT